MPDIEGLVTTVNDLETRLAKLESFDRPNQALDTASSVSFGDLTLSGALFGTRFVTGSWTGGYAGTTIAGVFTYTTNIGYYQRFNNICFVWNRITISAIPTPPTGNMRITGLPFTAAGVNDPMTFGLINFFNYSNTAFQLTAQTVLSTTQIALHESFDNAADVAVPAANFTNTACDLIFSGWYQLA